MAGRDAGEIAWAKLAHTRWLWQQDFNLDKIPPLNEDNQHPLLELVKQDGGELP